MSPLFFGGCNLLGRVQALGREISSKQELCACCAMPERAGEFASLCFLQKQAPLSLPFAILLHKKIEPLSIKPFRPLKNQKLTLLVLNPTVRFHLTQCASKIILGLQKELSKERVQSLLFKLG